MEALAFAVQLLNALPPLLAAGIEVTELVQAGNARIKKMQDEKRDPTDAEWKELNDRITAHQKELHASDPAPTPTPGPVAQPSTEPVVNAGAASQPR